MTKTNPTQSNHGKFPKILQIDDDFLQCLAARLALSKEGFKTQTAKNGQVGVTLAREWLPNLILMDVMMPVMNGIEATRILRSDPRTRHIPILALTGEARGETWTELKKAGVNEILEKPVEATKLMQKIKTYLLPRNGQHRAAANLFACRPDKQ